jgi:hypothetical protein
MEKISGDRKSAEWESSRPATTRTKPKAAWLADTLARVEKRKRKSSTAEGTESAGPKKVKATATERIPAKKKR